MLLLPTSDTPPPECCDPGDYYASVPAVSQGVRIWLLAAAVGAVTGTAGTLLALWLGLTPGAVGRAVLAVVGFAVALLVIAVVWLRVEAWATARLGATATAAPTASEPARDVAIVERGAR